MKFREWLNEASKPFKTIYKLTWLTDKGEEVSQNFPSIEGLISQEKWLKNKGWKIVKSQKRKPYGEWEAIPMV